MKTYLSTLYALSLNSGLTDTKKQSSVFSLYGFLSISIIALTWIMLPTSVFAVSYRVNGFVSDTDKLGVLCSEIPETWPDSVVNLAYTATTTAGVSGSYGGNINTKCQSTNTGIWDLSALGLGSYTGSLYVVFYENGVADILYYAEFDVVSGIPTTEQIENEAFFTRIDSITPSNDVFIATSTTHDFNFTGFVRTEHLNNTVIKFRLYNSACIADYYSPCNDTSLYFSDSDMLYNEYPDDLALSYVDEFLPLDGVYSDLGYFIDFGTTTRDLPIGRYKIDISIIQGSNCILGWCISQTIHVATTTQFYIDSETEFDALKDFQIDDALSYATSTVQRGIDCGYGSFNIFTCISDLFLASFVPDSGNLTYQFREFKENVFQKFPLGYITRFVEIASSDDTQDLPTLSYTFATSTISQGIVPSQLAGKTLAFDPWEQMSTSTNPLLTVESIGGNIEPKNVFDIVMPYFDMLVYLFLVLLIISELLQIQLIPSVTDVQTKTTSSIINGRKSYTKTDSFSKTNARFSYDNQKRDI